MRDAARSGTRLAGVLDDGDRDAVLAAVLDELAGSGRPSVLVVEDVHRADDATLDVLRSAGRRVELPAVIVATFRDEEVGRGLQRVLGALGGPTVHRLPLPRLSRAAVARLAGGTAALSAPLFRLTGGNPFFVLGAGAPLDRWRSRPAVLGRGATHADRAAAVNPNRPRTGADPATADPARCRDRSGR